MYSIPTRSTNDLEDPENDEGARGQNDDIHAAAADAEAHAAEVSTANRFSDLSYLFTKLLGQSGNDNVTLDVNSMGQIFAKCQVTDYRCRGEHLASYNMLDFFVNTYEEDIQRNNCRQLDAEDDDGDDGSENNSDDDEDLARKPGRPRNRRIPYLNHHPKARQKQRVIRSRNHRNLPNFVSRYYPRCDDPQIHSFYCACMLMLLKPWRDLHLDLKSPTQSWTAAFDQYLSGAPERVKFVISGIQYFHDCDTAAKERRDEEDQLEEIVGQRAHEFDFNGELDGTELGEDVEDAEVRYSEEGLASLVASQTPLQEETHAHLAVEIAKRARIFASGASRWELDQRNSDIANATGDDLRKLLSWKAQMKRDVLTQNTDSDAPCTDNDSSGDSGRVDRLDQNNFPVSQPEVSILAAETSLPPVDPSKLKADQFQSYDIIAWHLEQTLARMEPPPLRMIMYGEGGTGKSKVIQTVTEIFAQQGAKYMLVKSAYTGVAASLIDGKTTHTLASLSMNRDGTLSDESKAKLQQLWRYRQYLIIDEYSMIGKSHLVLLSRNISTGKEGSDSQRPGYSFGGINVILCGDLHQFPPVAQPPSESLYRPINLATDSIDCQLGCAIYEEFKTVVILKEQMRVTDSTWRDLLDHLRHGHMKEHHINILRKLIINHPEAAVDFTDDPWKNASLVTPRHAVRNSWNDAAVRKWCRETGQRLFVCTAEDTIRGRELTWAERYAVAGRGKNEKRRKRKDLPWKIELAKIGFIRNKQHHMTCDNM